MFHENDDCSGILLKLGLSAFHSEIFIINSSIQCTTLVNFEMLEDSFKFFLEGIIV